MNKQRHKEIEGVGITYERFAVYQVLKKLAIEYDIHKVLEIPASGAKAMPGLYSLGFALAGCDVYLINAKEEAKKVWHKLGFTTHVYFVEAKNIEHTELMDGAFDMVWNCIVFPTYKNPDKLLDEMIRLSNKYILTISVNGYNLGFPWHRFLHFITRIPWTHGNVSFYFINNMVKFFKMHHLKIIKMGIVDAPLWPDSIGFRDIRLHRIKIPLEDVDWYPTIIDYIKDDNYPMWIKILWKIEMLKLPTWINLLRAHLFYVLAEKLCQ